MVLNVRNVQYLNTNLRQIDDRNSILRKRDKKNKINVRNKSEKNMCKNKYLNGSAVLMSAVLVGFVPVSKLNAFGLSECGEAVVELANHSFESVAGFVVAVEPFVDDEFVAEIALFVFVPV